MTNKIGYFIGQVIGYVLLGALAAGALGLLALAIKFLIGVF